MAKKRSHKPKMTKAAKRAITIVKKEITKLEREESKHKETLKHVQHQLSALKGRK